MEPTRLTIVQLRPLDADTAALKIAVEATKAPTARGCLRRHRGRGCFALYFQGRKRRSVG